MSIKYIDCDITLKNILTLNRDLSEILKEEVLKQALLRSNQDRINKKRSTLWLKILKIDPVFANGEFVLF